MLYRIGERYSQQEALHNKISSLSHSFCQCYYELIFAIMRVRSCMSELHGQSGILE